MQFKRTAHLSGIISKTDQVIGFVQRNIHANYKQALTMCYTDLVCPILEYALESFASNPWKAGGCPMQGRHLTGTALHKSGVVEISGAEYRLWNHHYWTETLTKLGMSLTTLSGQQRQRRHSMLNNYTIRQTTYLTASKSKTTSTQVEILIVGATLEHSTPPTQSVCKGAKLWALKDCTAC